LLAGVAGGRADRIAKKMADWAGIVRRFDGRLQFIWTNAMSFDEILGWTAKVNRGSTVTR
jgi:hypothetical protein